MKFAMNNKPLPAEPAYDFPHELVKQPMDGGLCNIVVTDYPGSPGQAQLSRAADHSWYTQPLGTIDLYSTFADNGWSVVIQTGDITEVFPAVTKP